jgi:hypothetical protein
VERLHGHGHDSDDDGDNAGDDPLNGSNTGHHRGLDAPGELGERRP